MLFLLKAGVAATAAAANDDDDGDDGENDFFGLNENSECERLPDGGVVLVLESDSRRSSPVTGASERGHDDAKEINRVEVEERRVARLIFLCGLVKREEQKKRTSSLHHCEKASLGGCAKSHRASSHARNGLRNIAPSVNAPFFASSTPHPRQCYIRRTYRGPYSLDDPSTTAQLHNCQLNSGERTNCAARDHEVISLLCASIEFDDPPLRTSPPVPFPLA